MMNKSEKYFYLSVWFIQFRILLNTRFYIPINPKSLKTILPTYSSWSWRQYWPILCRTLLETFDISMYCNLFKYLKAQPSIWLWLANKLYLLQFQFPRLSFWSCGISTNFSHNLTTTDQCKFERFSRTWNDLIQNVIRLLH